MKTVLRAKNVEQNCIRLGKDLLGSVGYGRVCEGINIKTEVEEEDASGMELGAWEKMKDERRTMNKHGAQDMGRRAGR